MYKTDCNKSTNPLHHVQCAHCTKALASGLSTVAVVQFASLSVALSASVGVVRVADIGALCVVNVCVPVHGGGVCPS